MTFRPIPVSKKAPKPKAHPVGLAKPTPDIVKRTGTKGACVQAPTATPVFSNVDQIVTLMPDAIDQTVHGAMAKLTGGISPSALWEAYADWAVHLSISPGKQMHLAAAALGNAQRMSAYLASWALSGHRCDACILPAPHDRRFSGPGWQNWPFNVLSQSFLLGEEWWGEATKGVRGVTKAHENLADFTARQVNDIFSPSNYLLTNPEVIEATMREGGRNLVRGWQHFVQDWARQKSGAPDPALDAFKVGETLAVTPGQVVFRNRLIELIQYAPSTETVHPEPILIVPAWIMKYYILDLTQQNSMVKYLTDQGFTVFMISWKNPGVDDRDLGLEDYRRLGVMAALDAVCRIADGPKVHGVGYCLGGTLLALAASAMENEGDHRFADLSFFAAQTDFTEAGELTLFINESQVTFLEDMMAERGYLDSTQMAGTFQILRSKDLIWSKGVHHYLMGKDMPANDMMAWNADATRMPARMHSEYLRKLFLNNDFAEGRYNVDGSTVTLTDIRVPILAVGTEWDHVAPWKSVYKIHLFTDTDVTFLLTNGGHNAGIISEIGHPDRHFRMATKHTEDMYRDPQEWLERTEVHDGSWWPAFAAWLSERSQAHGAPPPMGKLIGDGEQNVAAPGTYVLER